MNDGVRGAAKQPVQLVELAALPLPADPLAFLLVPETPAVQQQEARPASGRTLVACVETLDALGQRGNELVVAGHALAGRVRPVGQQGKVEMTFGIGQVVHLESFELLLEVGEAREQRGHGDHGSKLRRHTLRELELRKPPGRKQSRNQAMDEGHRDLRGGHEAEEGQAGRGSRALPPRTARGAGDRRAGGR